MSLGLKHHVSARTFQADTILITTGANHAETEIFILHPNGVGYWQSGLSISLLTATLCHSLSRTAQPLLQVPAGLVTELPAQHIASLGKAFLFPRHLLWLTSPFLLLNDLAIHPHEDTSVSLTLPPHASRRPYIWACWWRERMVLPLRTYGGGILSHPLSYALETAQPPPQVTFGHAAEPSVLSRRAPQSASSASLSSSPFWCSVFSLSLRDLFQTQ